MSKKISLSVFIFVLLAAILVTFLCSFVVVSRVYDAELREAYLSQESPSVISDGKFEELKFLDSLFKAYSYFDVDEDAIAEAKALATKEAVANVLPAFDSNEQSEQMIDDMAIVVYKAVKGSDVVGYAVESMSKNGFGC